MCTALSNVVITGLGPVSAVGVGRDAFWNSIVAGRAGFGPITLCDAADSPSRIAAEVTDFDLADHVRAGRAIARRAPRPVQFSLAAAHLAWDDAQLACDAIDSTRTGIYVGSSLGNLGEVLEHVAGLDSTTGDGLPSYGAFYSFHHSAACALSSYFDLHGPVATSTCGCNSGIDALGQAARMIQAGMADVMIVVGTDCEVVPQIIAGLNAAGALSTRYNDDPHRASRPFDVNRDGNVIGEGAAALILESADHARARGAHAYARIAGYRQDAVGRRQYSASAPTQDAGPGARVMNGLLHDIGWSPESVDTLSANGSSSVVYDQMEAVAIADVFGPTFPRLPVHSIKSMLGQHGAGSTALQAVAACLSIRDGIVPPTINCDQPDPACGPIRVRGEAERRPISRVLTNAIGFGGFYYATAAFEAA